MILGIDNLRAKQYEILSGKRIGLLSHLAAVSASGRTTAELLHDSVDLVALFGPEHGFLGQALAGENTEFFEHPTWHIPVYSLYGKYREPTVEMVEGLDSVVCDLQDLGVRCYTYLATLRNLMKVCEKAHVEVIVLDRPVPLPCCIDGPIRDEALDSFVAPAPFPFVYGMTLAESARWMRDNLYPDVRLSVVPMEVASRGEILFDALPRFEKPSPGIRTKEAALLYPMTVFTEAIPSIDCGLGTELAFQVVGAPWMDGEAFCERLAEEPLAGLTAQPCRFTSAREYAGKTFCGIRFAVQDRNAFRPFTSGMTLLRRIFQTYGLENSWRQANTRPEWFDKLYGAPAIREALLSGRDFDYDIASFLTSRDQALLYSKRSL